MCCAKAASRMIRTAPLSIPNRFDAWPLGRVHVFRSIDACEETRHACDATTLAHGPSLLSTYLLMLPLSKHAPYTACSMRQQARKSQLALELVWFDCLYSLVFVGLWRLVFNRMGIDSEKCVISSKTCSELILQLLLSLSVDLCR